MRFLVLDVATVAIDNAADLVDGDSITAPANYKDQAKIDAYIAEKKAERLERAGLDVDLCRISALGWSVDGGDPVVELCRDEDEETCALLLFRDLVSSSDHYAERPSIVTWNGLRFDLPVLLRRYAYLGLAGPKIDMDRYRSPHVDLSEAMTYRGLLAPKPLTFYTRRLGWSDLSKPLTGAEEAKVAQTGRWGDLEASVRHDVVALTRLARWWGILPKVREHEPVL